jgi:hypothetical protein
MKCIKIKKIKEATSIKSQFPEGVASCGMRRMRAEPASHSLSMT